MLVCHRYYSSQDQSFLDTVTESSIMLDTIQPSVGVNPAEFEVEIPGKNETPTLTRGMRRCNPKLYLPPLLSHSISLSFPHSEHTPLLKVALLDFFLTYEMGDQSRSTGFRTLFESALQAYEKKTGITLAEHPLAVQLQSCLSVESITALVQDQASASSEFLGKDRIMQSIRSIVSMINTLSTTTSLWYPILLVRRTGT